MQAIKSHLALQHPRFICKDTSEKQELTVALSNEVGRPATQHQLERLRQFAGNEFDALAPLYTQFNGLAFHLNGETAGLWVATIDDLQRLNLEWREWFVDLDPAELYAFQREGVAFATIAASGNYFVVHGGRVFYSDHDGGDDAVWGESLERFFVRALSDPARFLHDAGCYTRYSDGKTDSQFIPESFAHD